MEEQCDFQPPGLAVDSLKKAADSLILSPGLLPWAYLCCVYMCVCERDKKRETDKQKRSMGREMIISTRDKKIMFSFLSL